MEKRIAGVEPAKRRESEESVAAELLTKALKILAHGRNSVLADETIDLEPEGHERDEINRSEGANENVPRTEVGWAPDFVSPEHSGDERGQLAIARDKAVSGFCHQRETGHMF